MATCCPCLVEYQSECCISVLNYHLLACSHWLGLHLPRFPLAHVRSTWSNGSIVTPHVNYVNSNSRHKMNWSGRISLQKGSLSTLKDSWLSSVGRSGGKRPRSTTCQKITKFYFLKITEKWDKFIPLCQYFQQQLVPMYSILFINLIYKHFRYWSAKTPSNTIAHEMSPFANTTYLLMSFFEFVAEQKN